MGSGQSAELSEDIGVLVVSLLLPEQVRSEFSELNSKVLSVPDS